VQSATRWVAWAAVAAWAGVIFAGSSVPGSRLPGGYSVYGHLGEYAVLGLLLALAMWRGRPPWRVVALAVIMASAYGVTDEFHQSFVPMRTPDPVDWATDTVGALAGALLGVTLIRRRIASSTEGGSPQ
jgi:VanZ family protein